MCLSGIREPCPGVPGIVKVLWAIPPMALDASVHLLTQSSALALWSWNSSGKMHPTGKAKKISLELCATTLIMCVLRHGKKPMVKLQSSFRDQPPCWGMLLPACRVLFHGCCALHTTAPLQHAGCIDSVVLSASGRADVGFLLPVSAPLLPRSGTSCSK